MHRPLDALLELCGLDVQSAHVGPHLVLVRLAYLLGAMSNARWTHVVRVGHCASKLLNFAVPRKIEWYGPEHHPQLRPDYLQVMAELGSQCGSRASFLTRDSWHQSSGMVPG